MNILFVICARAGSKGAKSKNTRQFCGLPLVARTLSAFDLFLNDYVNNQANDPYTDSASAFDGLFSHDKRSLLGVGTTLAVNTDSAVLLDQMAAQKVPYIVLERKNELAGDRSPKIAVVADSLSQAEVKTGLKFDLVVDMDLTSPLRRAADIFNILACFLKTSPDVALSVTAPRRNPYFNQLAKRQDGFLGVAIPSDYVARQQAPEVFDANASLYCYNPDYLRNNDGILLHARLAGSQMPDTAVLDIDSDDDFELLTLLSDFFERRDPELMRVRRHAEEIFRS